MNRIPFAAGLWYNPGKTQGAALRGPGEDRMMRMNLNDGWRMTYGGKDYACDVPCSMYDTLARAGAIPDPYAGENEWAATPLSDGDTTFTREVEVSAEFRTADRMALRFEGIDTLGEVFWDGRSLGRTDNMHRTWEFPLVAGTEGRHSLRVKIQSPSRYVTEAQRARPLWGVEQAMPGYPHLRKAHCMFGWDWGPILPDMGIWRPVSLTGWRGGRILQVLYTQRHEAGAVLLRCRAETECWREGVEAVWTVTSPEGEVFTAPLRGGEGEIRSPNPRLWWVRGLGEQPLYRCEVTLRRGEEVLDRQERRVGLRTLTVSQERDEWGKEFCFVNNGVKFFAMGANYIPEDQLIPRCTKARTERLLADCVRANYNTIRVWGGGWYPDDWFYDFCDENGLAVWQDFMFACATYRLTPDFEATVRQEIRDNVVRLRNHPSLALWCGNNEIESAWEGWGLPEDPEAKGDYTKLFEGIMPEMLRELDPDTFYWPSSPSSGGGFQDSSSNAAGDMHYWAVWHNFKPIKAFRQYYYRYCSEYGFESLPDIRTIRAFAEEKDFDLCGPVMEAHQKCTQGTEKLLYYLGQMTNYPYDFERLIYCSQLVQADCIRSNVEHMRRARGRCMGSTYWQVNDSNPVISWSSIDSFGRWKGLHYAARRFYAPILLSCDDTDPARPALYVTNDTPRDERLRVECHLRDREGRILDTFTAEEKCPALKAERVLTLDLAERLAGRAEKRSRYLEYRLLRGDEVLSEGTTLFVRPKTFAFRPTHVRAEIREAGDDYRITLRADGFAKSVCLSLTEGEGVFSDNWFDLHGDREKTVTLSRAECGLEPAALRAGLRITHYCPAAE